MNFATRLSAAAGAAQARLQAQIATLPPSAVRDAMAYAVQGGKGLRAFLVIEGAALHRVPIDHAVTAAAAVEALHAFSLIHDDLPAMDNDDLRRGRPTVHVVWSEAVAVLAGDALQAMAFELLAQPGQPRVADMVRSLATGAGGAGMVYGQMLDMAAETAVEPLTLEQITELQAGKTGALFEWAATAGPRMAGADCAPLAGYARALGLAFQIADDILDATGDPELAGKRLQKDADAGKATFVSLLGLEPARARARDLAEQAISALTPYGADADPLRQAARFAIARDR